jgi:uncharacterized protein YdcH (DUF465 family)
MPMTAEHDLNQEFREFRDELAERRKRDPGFDGLVDRYLQLDKRILDLEGGNQPRDDDSLNRLRKERVLLKDKITQQLQYAS